MPVPATLAVAVGANAVLGFAGYIPYILTVLLVQQWLVETGRAYYGWQVGAPLPVLIPIVIGVWLIYPPFVHAANRKIMGRSALPRSRYLAIVTVALLAGFAAAVVRLWGLTLA
jgi:hypothetical protein